MATGGAFFYFYFFTNRDTLLVLLVSGFKFQKDKTFADFLLCMYTIDNNSSRNDSSHIMVDALIHIFTCLLQETI